MKTILSLLLLLLVTPHLARAQSPIAPCDALPAGERPTIDADLEIADYIHALPFVPARPDSLPESAPEFYRNYRGLLIEENLVRELYPLLMHIYFDAGSSAIGEQYILLKSVAETRSFDDTTIPGGTLQKYFHLLNIVGHRMRANPATTIELVGCSSEEPGLGETKATAKARAETIRRYLVDVWEIDGARIRVLPARGYPEARSNPRDPVTNEENRRVEIRSKDWSITRPILQQELRRYPQPESMRYNVRDGIADDLVERREIVITRGGAPWHLIPVGPNDTAKEYNWGRNGNESDVPIDEIPYRAELVVYLKDGSVCRSEIAETKVLIVDNERKRRERLVEKTIDRYSLVLFPYGSSTLDRTSERAINDIIAPTVGKRSRILVGGYSCEEAAGEKLSEARAKRVADVLHNRIAPSASAQLRAVGYGAMSPLYTVRTPEGRAHNRTVQVIIETPTGPE